jgi:hypothetical protein
MCRDTTSRGLLTENTAFPCSVSRNTTNIDTAVKCSRPIHNEILLGFTEQRKRHSEIFKELKHFNVQLMHTTLKT